MFKKWFSKSKPVDEIVISTDFDNMNLDVSTLAMPQGGSSTYTISSIASAGSMLSVNTGNIGNTTFTIPPGSWAQSNYSIGVSPSSTFSLGDGDAAPIISIHGGTPSREIVRLNKDGSVSWAAGIEIDEAAKALSDSIQLSAESAAGIVQGVKLRMRDSVFEDIIGIAREKGALTADDLTYLLEASKIVEKLKSKKE